MELGAVVAVLAALQLIMVNRYGPHRDELYFVAAGQHLAWGYPDQPSFTPLLARLATELAPHNLLALRLPSILAMALLVVCAAAFARLLDGGRAAQVLTASTVAASVDHHDAGSSPQHCHIRHTRLDRRAPGCRIRPAG